MAQNPSVEVQRFIAAAKEKGASDEAIVGMLENEGWPKSEIWKSLASHYESISGVKLPPEKNLPPLQGTRSFICCRFRP